MHLLVSVFSFPFYFLFFCPRFGLAPQNTMLMVVPVVFEAGLACFLEVHKGTVLVVTGWSALRNRKGQIVTQPHCVCFAGFTFGFGQRYKVVEFALVILYVMDWVQNLVNFWVLQRQFTMVSLL
jgi:hypothetical protein